MNGILVERPGIMTTVQDLGRFGWQHLGIVPAGAMDTRSLRLSNVLVGNPAATGALEITLRGPTLRFEVDSLVALCGAGFATHVERSGNEASLPANRPVLLAAGTRLSIEQAARGVRAYLAVAGGFAIEPVLGSCSTYVPAGFGGFLGRPLRSGDQLPLRDRTGAAARGRFAKLARHPERLIRNEACRSVRWTAPVHNLPIDMAPAVRVIDGRHRSQFTEAAIEAFESSEFRIAADSNRMGYRMLGQTLARTSDADVLSEPTTLGTIQVPADGMPIVLMADHQTTGGYAKIAEVASVDIPRLAQLGPGGKVRFVRCTLEAALRLGAHERAALVAIEQAIAWEYA